MFVLIKERPIPQYESRQFKEPNIKQLVQSRLGKPQRTFLSRLKVQSSNAVREISAL